MNEGGSASYAVRDRTYVLRLQGAIRYTLGHALDTFIERREEGYLLVAPVEFRTA